MEIKVREVSEVESKSTQQVEQELLDKHEAELNGEPAPEAEPAAPALSEDEVRSFLSSRYGREIGSLDELNEVRETQVELPEVRDVLQRREPRISDGRVRKVQRSKRPRLSQLEQSFVRDLR